MIIKPDVKNQVFFIVYLNLLLNFTLNNVHAKQFSIMENITVDRGIYSITYTKDELRKEIEDLYFLKDAMLTMLNPDVAEKSDIPFNKEETIEHLKELYSESNYNEDFIKEIFANVK